MWDYVEVLRDVRVVVMIFQRPGGVVSCRDLASAAP